MFINNFDPVAFQIFSLEIRWYSLAYIIGIGFGCWPVYPRWCASNPNGKEAEVWHGLGEHLPYDFTDCRIWWGENFRSWPRGGVAGHV